jgi:hypothetical protein
MERHVEISQMTVGSPYFIVVFEDEGLTIPLVQTLVFNGIRTKDDRTRWLSFTELRPNGDEVAFKVEESHAHELLLDRAALVEKLKQSFSGKLATERPR